MNIKKDCTTEDLVHLKIDIEMELKNRKKEPVIKCYVVRLNNCESGATYFKDYEAAREEFLAEMDYTVCETGNKFSIEPVEIPESDYNIRPDVWYS